MPNGLVSAKATVDAKDPITTAPSAVATDDFLICFIDIPSIVLIVFDVR